MIDSLAGNPGIARAAMQGITLRVQKQRGAPVDDDPDATTVVVDAPLEQSMAQAASDDLDGGAYDDVYPQADMMDANTTNQTSYLENNYPLAVQPPDSAAAGLDPSMMDPSMLAGSEGPGGARKTARRGAIMKGLGF